MKSGYSLKEHSASIALTLRALDVIALFISGLLCFWLRFSHVNLSYNYKSVFLIGILLSLLSLSASGAYRAWRGISFFTEIRCVASAISFSFILLILSVFATQSSELFSRIWVVSWPISSCILILLYRFTLRKSLGVLRARGKNVRYAIIIGHGELAQEVATKLIENPSMGLVVRGYISDNGALAEEENSCHLNYLGNLEDLDKTVADLHIDQVWIALPMAEVEQMKKIQRVLTRTSVTIRMVPDVFGFQLLNHSITEIAGLPVINLSTSQMLEGRNRFLKSLEDKILSAIILICISPILALIAIAIKLTSPGPILFKQYRTGANGQKVKVYKFRSMVVHQEKAGEVTQATKGDSRITKIGSFLRRTSLDELPQFINVLQGRMSIVGPRPHALAHNQYYRELVESYMRRHMVKPGITGWAQINGYRGETDTIDKMENRVKYDLYYIENWSIWLDLKIIFLTIFKGFIHKNAV